MKLSPPTSRTELVSQIDFYERRAKAEERDGYHYTAKAERRKAAKLRRSLRWLDFKANTFGFKKI